MGSLTEISRHFASLQEIGDIMTAMKNLAWVETRKLSRSIGHQRRMLANIEAAAGDFLHHFPFRPASDTRPVILLLIGSERGFCGSFNERIIDTLDRLPHIGPPPALLSVGSRLGMKLADRPGLIGRLDGASLTEDVPNVLSRLMDTLQRHAGGGATLQCLSQTAECDPALKPLLPFSPQIAAHHGHPPRLDLPPPEFLAGLLDQYLLAVLSGVLYESLAAENRQRLAHMEHALDRLDETLTRMAIQRNTLRQEKIVEEIEVILSSAQALVRGSH